MYYFASPHPSSLHIYWKNWARISPSHYTVICALHAIQYRPSPRNYPGHFFSLFQIFICTHNSYGTVLFIYSTLGAQALFFFIYIYVYQCSCVCASGAIRVEWNQPRRVHPSLSERPYKNEISVKSSFQRFATTPSEALVVFQMFLFKRQEDYLKKKGKKKTCF